MSIKTNPLNLKAWERFKNSISPPRIKNNIKEKAVLPIHWIKRYVLAGIYCESFLFVILLKASPCTPISANNPPVIRSPSFESPVAPEAKSKISPLRPINTEITFNRVIFSYL